MNVNKENLIEMLPKIGAWSTYALAEIALSHYFPNLPDKDGYISTAKAAEYLHELGFSYWNEVIIKYHNEIGYSKRILSNKNLVNEN